MKKFITLLTVFVLIFTIAVSSVVSADGEAATRNVGPGGLDFYSITIHYESPILMSYYQKTGSTSPKLFVNPTVTEGDVYVDKKGVSLMSDKLVIGGNKSGDFYVVSSTNDPDNIIYPDITAAAKPSAFAFYNHINDGNVLMQVEATNFYGLTKPYDEGEPYENKNPNVIYGSDGYALAVETDAEGNPYRIDINGYTITSNNMWICSDGRRCELFINLPVVRKTGKVSSKGVPVTEWANTDVYQAIDVSDKFDDNGKLKNTKAMTYVYYVSNDDYNAFLADDSQLTLTPSLYEFQAKRSDYETTEDYEDAIDDELKTFDNNNKIFKTYPVMYKLKYADDIVDVNGDGVKNYLDDATYYTREMTSDDILTTTVEGKTMPVNGTPIIGTPQVNVKIKDITIEIDALGTQLYDDLSQDPQQQNLIHITINDCLKNVEFFDRCLAENRITQEVYDAMEKSFLATVKSQTTKTVMQGVTTKSETFRSISLGLDADTLANLSRNEATIYLNFEIKTQQPAAAYEQYSIAAKTLMNEDKFSPISITLKTEADLPPVIKGEEKGCFSKSSASAVAQVMLVLGAALIIKSKKK